MISYLNDYLKIVPVCLLDVGVTVVLLDHVEDVGVIIVNVFT